MSIRKIRTSWWVDFRHAGERYRMRSPLNTRHGAEDYELTLRGRLNRGEPIDGLETSEAEVTTFGEFVEKWFRTYVRANNSPSEQRAKESVMRNHLLPAFGSESLAAIGGCAIEQYKAAKLSIQLKAKTINNHLAMLGCALATAVEWKVLGSSPRIKPMKVPPSRVDFLSDHECAQLLSTRTELVWDVMVLAALRTGLRQGELLALQWDDLDLERRQLTVNRSVVRGTVTSPKSNKVRHIPMTSDLREAFTTLPRTSSLVFPRDGGGHLSDSMANKALERIRRRAGLRHLHWHLFRHTFASQLVRRGTPLRKVQLLLGHSTIQMTERYAHLAPSDLDGTVDVLEPDFATNPWKFGQPVVNGQVSPLPQHAVWPANTG